jgi:hypothetical protein
MKSAKIFPEINIKNNYDKYDDNEKIDYATFLRELSSSRVDMRHPVYISPQKMRNAFWVKLW